VSVDLLAHHSVYPIISNRYLPQTFTLFTVLLRIVTLCAFYVQVLRYFIALSSGAQRRYLAPGARSKFGAPMFEPEVFRRQMHCIAKVLVTLLGLFGAPRSHATSRSDLAPSRVVRRPGNCAPLTPLVTALVVMKIGYKTQMGEKLGYIVISRRFHFTLLNFQVHCRILSHISYSLM